MKWFYDLRIAKKLAISFGVMAVIAAAVGFMGYKGIGDVKDNQDIMYKDCLTMIHEFSEANTSLLTIRGNLLAAISAPSNDLREKYLSEVGKHQQKLDEIVAVCNKLDLSAEEAPLYKDFSNAWEKYRGLSRSASTYISQQRFSEAISILYGEGLQPITVARTSLASLIDANAELAKTLHHDTDDDAMAAMNQMLLLLSFGVVLALGLGWFITTSIRKPISQLVTNIDNADLNSQFNSTLKDEIGDLQRSFDKFVGSIRETLLQVSEASSAVASASSEISSSTEQMAAGAEEQTSQANEVASAVEEMAKTIIENSRNANVTAGTAREAKAAAEQGGKVVEETIGGMKQIAAVVRESAATVQSLGRSSDQIGEIIGVINDIADQTNLLALNAAIEAARAGEQGRGFAVVADEVRKLAERTTKATKEIAAMIKKIQEETRGAVISMEQGTKKVDEGIQLADKAGESLKQIVRISQEVTEKIAQIAAASEEQSSASEQISKNVEAISGVTNESATGVQQIARTAEDLNRLTESLQKLVERFQLSAPARRGGDPLTTVHQGHKQLRAYPKADIAVRANGVLTTQEH